MSVVGKIEYITNVDTSGLDDGLKESEKRTSDFGSKVGSGLAKVGKVAAVGLTAAATAAGAMAKSAVQSYAEYEQLVGGVKTLFKDSQGIVMEYAANAYKTAGVSANEYMATVTGFSASLLQSLGGDTEKAAKYADQAMIDMADNANKMGTSMESIQYAYQGFAKQNYTMLDNLKLGYGGTRGEMERLLKDAEAISGIHFEMDNFADMTQAIHVIQNEMGITGTTAKEAADTIQGSIGSMKAAWSNLVTGMADENADMGKLIDDFIQTAGTAAKNLIPVIKQALGSIANLIKEIAPIIAEQLPSLIDEIVPGAILNAIIEALPGLLVTLAEALVAYLPTLIDTLVSTIPTLFQGIMQIIQGLIQMLPQLLPQIVSAIYQIATMLTSPQNLQMILQAGIELLMALVKAIPEMVVAVVNALPDLITNIVSFLVDPANIAMIIQAAIELFFGLVKAVPQILGALLGAFGKLVGNLWDGIKGMFGDFAGKFGEFITGIFKGAINGILGFIEGFINTPINILNGFIDIINGAFGWIGVNLGKIDTIKLPRLASGGIVPATPGGQIIMAGEAGEDEWVVPESKMASLIEQLNKGNDDEENNTTFNFTFNGVLGTPSELRELAVTFHDKYEEVKKARML